MSKKLLSYQQKERRRLIYNVVGAVTLFSLAVTGVVLLIVGLTNV